MNGITTKMNTDYLPQDGIILCAVSGGIDSMYLLCRLREEGYTVSAAHFNHGLRGKEADRDEAFVRSFCAERGIPFYIGRGDVSSYAEKHRLGIEESARFLRYRFLETTADEIGAVCIATAHTADDNAETVLMNLIRGAGIRGLSGIPPVRGRIVRPILGVTRKEAEAWLEAHGISHVEDSTNAGDEYTRNRIRHTIMPLLEAENPSFVSAVSRTSGLLREDESYLSGLAREYVHENATEDGIPTESLLALPAAVARRAVQLLAGRSLEEKHVRAVLDVARYGGMADVPGMRIGCSEGKLVFGVSEKPALPDRTIAPGDSVELPEAGLTAVCEKIKQAPADVYKSLNTFYFKCENICGNIKLTSRREGDRYRPSGRGCTKTLKSLFLETGIPSWERRCVPVLRDEKGILGVYGFPADERVCAAPGEADVLKIGFFRGFSEKEDFTDASGC